jgi:hypothetical protein
MGFTPQQARIALASTDTGLDVDQALETLIANTEESAEVEARDLDIDRLATIRRSRPPLQQPSRSSSNPNDRPRPRPTKSSDSSRQSGDEGVLGIGYQEQVDNLISQATVLGRGMFSKANAFWKESKEKVQKAYEEHQAQQPQQQGGRPNEPRQRDGRPKWMAEEHAEGFRDDDDGQTSPSSPKFKNERSERIGTGLL